jgi:hypothetical protein
MVKIFLLEIVIYIILFSLIPEYIIQRYVQLVFSVYFFGFLNGVFLHFFLFHFYLHFIQIIDRSPSTRILVELENAPERKLTLEQLKERYSLDKKIDDELEDMVILGRLDKDGDFYVNTLKGQKHNKIFKLIREYLKLEKA